MDANISEKPYWVEADRAVKNREQIIGYSVWRFGDGREKVHSFRVTRKGGWQVALHLANITRDDLNAGIA